MQLVDTILTYTADVFDRTCAEIVGRSRKRPIVEARQAAMWMIRLRYPSLSLESIGTAVGGRHYSTVMHALSVVEHRALHDAVYREQLKHLIARVTAPSKSIGSVTTVSQPCRAGSWTGPVDADAHRHQQQWRRSYASAVRFSWRWKVTRRPPYSLVR